jgi:UDP-GlcNAc:undecaprenyl-phosphate/decaprenyl-phosphate GlcNAc-1-phosphate transferase
MQLTVSKTLRIVVSNASISDVPGELTTAVAAVTCATFVTVAEPLLIPVLRRAAVDVPNGRSSHTVATPRGGGAPIAVGLVVAALLIHGAVAVTFAVAVAAFAAIGFADDLSGLPAGRRLLMQGLSSLAIAGVLVERIGLPWALAAAAAVLLAVWLIGFVNAFNFMDGVNGISGAHALIGGAFYACLGWWRPDAFLAAAGAAVAAGALAFLPWNAVRARVFLGDAGSYGLGVALALLAAYAVIRHIPPEAALAPLALYLADTGWTLQRRVRAGERVLEAHRTHTYQQLCDVGWSHQRVTLTTAGVTAAVCLLGAASLTGHPALRAAADLAAAGLLAVYLSSPVLLGGAPVLSPAEVELDVEAEAA